MKRQRFFSALMQFFCRKAALAPLAIFVSAAFWGGLPEMPAAANAAEIVPSQTNSDEVTPRLCSPLGSTSQRPRDSWYRPSRYSVDPELAEKAFDQWSDWDPPQDIGTKFHFSTKYPTKEPEQKPMLWDDIAFNSEPEEYMREVLKYCVKDLEETDFNLENTKWYHTPWLAREPIHGLTYEITSDPGVLHPSQERPVENWAVGYYNELGGYTIGQVWRNKSEPNTNDVAFPIGTVSCKLLFTQATPKEVPYLEGTKQWTISREEYKTEPLHLLQFDFAVRDRRADPTTGWVFGSFMYLQEDEAPRAFSFGDLVPVGLMWGNDPTLGFTQGNGESPTEGWMNPRVVRLFSDIRKDRETQSLGRYGRTNGPVDNPKSACLACHARAVANDWTGKERELALPWAPPWDTDQEEIATYFRNLKPDEPFCDGADSLDYSLQLAFGIEFFNEWRREVGRLVEDKDGAGASSGQVVSLFSKSLDGGSTTDAAERSWMSVIDAYSRRSRGEERTGGASRPN